MPRTLTWLHLSDLHACPRDKWQSDHITRSLVADLKKMENEHGLSPDFIFFTGDAAWGTDDSAKATLPQQFEAAHTFFEAVRKAFAVEVPQRRFYIVPGNHDVDRKRVTNAIAKHLPSAPLAELQAAFNEPGDDLADYMRRLDEYGNFLSNMGYAHLTKDTARQIFFDSQNLVFSKDDESDSVRVGIVGFNSAWTCGKDDTRGGLRLCGAWQHGHLHQNIHTDAIRIALIHHPGGWFKDHVERTTMRNLENDYHFLLHGHEHESWVDHKKLPCAEPHLHSTISAGACYDREGFPNGYNFVQLNLDSGEGHVYLRRLTSGGRVWAKYTDAPSAPDGVWPITCPQLVSPTGVVAAKSPSTRRKSDAKKADDTLRVKDSSAGDRYEKQLRDATIEEHGSLDLPGISISKAEAKKYDLNVAYVTLKLAKGSKADMPDSGSTEFLLDNLPQDAPRLFLTGKAGCGKTTLLKWITIQAAHDVLRKGLIDLLSEESMRRFIGIPKSVRGGMVKGYIHDAFSHFETNEKALGKTLEPGERKLAAETVKVLRNWRLKLPLLIRLRDCKGGRLPALKDLPGPFADHLTAPPPDFFKDLLEKGGMIILLDGVDELPSDERTVAETEIRKWIKAYPRCHYVITSRPDAVPEGWLGNSAFTHAKVEDLTPEDRGTFIDYWHKAVAVHYTSAQKAAEVGDACARLKEALRSNLPVARLMTNPLLAAAICALHLDGKADLPRSEGEVCEELCKMLVEKRDLMQGVVSKGNGTRGGYEKLEYAAHKKELLRQFADAMMVREKSHLPIKDAEALVAELLASFPHLKECSPVEICKELIDRSGLLRMGSGEHVEFLHNTFKEYLAAELYAGKDTKDVIALAKWAINPAWQPVLRFLAMRAVGSSGKAGALVREILRLFPKPAAKSQKDRKKNRPAHFLLVQIGAITGLTDDLHREIDSLRREFLPPRTLSDAEAIAVCGDVAIPELRRIGNPDRKSRAACVRALGKMETFEAEQELDEYLKDDATEVLAELARYRNPLAFPLVIAAFKKHGGPPAWCPRDQIRDLAPLAQIDGLRELYLSGCRGLKSLEPLRVLKRVEILECGNTPIDSLEPLREMRRLKTLDFMLTEVNSLDPLRELIQLRNINCFDADVDSLEPLRGLKQLQELGCAYTGISSLEPLQALTHLKELDCESTNVSSLEPLQRLKELQKLHCGYTDVISLEPLRKMTRLHELDCCATAVSSLEPLRGLTELESLDCKSTNIRDLEPIQALTRLVALGCDFRALIDLGPLSKIKHLKELSCRIDDGSQLEHLRAIEPLAYIRCGAPLTKLQKLQFLGARQKLGLRPVRFQ